MKTFLRLLALFLTIGALYLPAPSIAQDDEPVSLILRANDFYNEKEYQQAADVYEDLIAKGYRNGNLYYNLGNAYIRLGDNGKAILNYLRAKRLLPRDKDIDANLKYATQETLESLEWKKPSLLSTFFFWASDFSFQEHLQILVAINLLFWISMGVWLVKKTETLDIMRKSLMALLLVALVSTMVKWHLDTSQKLGVVFANKIDVKSGMDPEQVTLFQLHKGAVVFIEEEKGDWYKIELSDGKSGWAKKSLIGA